MKRPTPLHSWELSPKEAAALQRRLAARVRIERPSGPIRFVAGLDAAFSRDGRRCLAAAVVWDCELRRPVEEEVAEVPLKFPYIPGLLSFREAPALLAALDKLRRAPDALMCDGQGVAHPRRFGIASHMGVFCDLPSVGCAKSRLTGAHEEPGLRRGSWTPLVDGGEQIGLVLRTRDRVRPLYVSVGHKMDLETARELTLRCGAGFRLPEPTRLADRLVAEAKKKLGK